MVNSRRIRSEGHVACMGSMANVHKIRVRKLEEKKLFGIIMVKWILKRHRFEDVD
jgi:hypothetical protein